MALNRKAWEEFTRLRDKAQEYGYSLTTGYRTRAGRRWNFCAKLLEESAAKEEPKVFRRLPELRTFVSSLEASA